VIHLNKPPLSLSLLYLRIEKQRVGRMCQRGGLVRDCAPEPQVGRLEAREDPLGDALIHLRGFMYGWTRVRMDSD